MRLDKGLLYTTRDIPGIHFQVNKLRSLPTSGWPLARQVCMDLVCDITYISVDPFGSTEIKNPFGIQGQQAAKMWKDLTDTYRRKIKSGSSGEPLDEKSSNWKFFDCMSFLKNFIDGRK